MDVRIVLLPDEQSSQKVIKLSSTIEKKYPTLFTLNKTNIPHVTLLHVAFANEKFEKVCREITQVAEKQQQITVTSNKINHGTESKTFIGMYFQNDQELIRLREVLYTRINSFLDKTASFKTPHLTLTRLKHEEDVEKVLMVYKNLREDNQTYTKIAICETGENGTCTKILCSVPLT